MELIVNAKACFGWISIKRQSKKSLNLKHNRLNIKRIIKRNIFEVLEHEWDTECKEVSREDI